MCYKHLCEQNNFGRWTQKGLTTGKSLYSSSLCWVCTNAYIKLFCEYIQTLEEFKWWSNYTPVTEEWDPNFHTIHPTSLHIIPLRNLCCLHCLTQIQQSWKREEFIQWSNDRKCLCYGYFTVYYVSDVCYGLRCLLCNSNRWCRVIFLYAVHHPRVHSGIFVRCLIMQLWKNKDRKVKHQLHRFCKISWSTWLNWTVARQSKTNQILHIQLSIKRLTKI